MFREFFIPVIKSGSSPNWLVIIGGFKGSRIPGFQGSSGRKSGAFPAEGPANHYGGRTCSGELQYPAKTDRGNLMENKLVKTIGLKNNLWLKIYDHSKKMAGDRWLVSMIAQVDIPVSSVTESLHNLQHDPDSDKDEILKLLGSTVTFEQKRERFFIDESKKESVFNEVCDHFVKSTINYLSHPDFPKKFVIMKLKEKKKKDLLKAATG